MDDKRSKVSGSGGTGSDPRSYPPYCIRRLSMFLPSGQIGNLVLLNSDLRVNYNSFTGPIPTELGRLTDVTISKFRGSDTGYLILLESQALAGW